MAATVTRTPDCGPALPQGFAVFMDVSGFPPNSFLSFELCAQTAAGCSSAAGWPTRRGLGFPAAV
jgi:hypothetical protein